MEITRLVVFAFLPMVHLVESCTDDSSYSINMTSCEDLTKSLSYKCYDPDVASFCCSSCALLNNSDPECPYGDRQQCSPTDCEVNTNSILCCHTCRQAESGVTTQHSLIEERKRTRRTRRTRRTNEPRTAQTNSRQTNEPNTRDPNIRTGNTNSRRTNEPNTRDTRTEGSTTGQTTTTTETPTTSTHSTTTLHIETPTSESLSTVLSTVWSTDITVSTQPPTDTTFTNSPSLSQQTSEQVTSSTTESVISTSPTFHTPTTEQESTTFTHLTTTTEAQSTKSDTSSEATRSTSEFTTETKTQSTTPELTSSTESMPETSPAGIITTSETSDQTTGYTVLDGTIVSNKLSSSEFAAVLSVPLSVILLSAIGMGVVARCLASRKRHRRHRRRKFRRTRTPSDSSSDDIHYPKDMNEISEVYPPYNNRQRYPPNPVEFYPPQPMPDHTYGPSEYYPQGHTDMDGFNPKPFYGPSAYAYNGYESPFNGREPLYNGYAQQMTPPFTPYEYTDGYNSGTPFWHSLAKHSPRAWVSKESLRAFRDNRY